MVTLDPAPLPTEGLVPLPARKGTLVLLHGQLPHRSGPNRSDRSRHAYALHLIDGACPLQPRQLAAAGCRPAAAGFLT